MGVALLTGCCDSSHQIDMHPPAIYSAITKPRSFLNSLSAADVSGIHLRFKLIPCEIHTPHYFFLYILGKRRGMIKVTDHSLSVTMFPHQSYLCACLNAAVLSDGPDHLLPLPRVVFHMRRHLPHLPPYALPGHCGPEEELAHWPPLFNGRSYSWW